MTTVFSSLSCIFPQHERVGRNIRQMTDVRIFYTDEENDDIFVGSDDEYKELLKVAALKNKVCIVDILYIDG